MPETRLQRTRTAYLTDRDPGDENDYGSEQPSPDTRCTCGAGLNEPHAPECWQTQEPGYGMGV